VRRNKTSEKPGYFYTIFKQGEDMAAKERKTTKPGKVGRPPLYSDPAKLEEKINAYFDWCDSQTRDVPQSRGGIKVVYKAYTIGGLCLYLGISKDTFSEYAKRPEFAETIKKARTRVETWTEEHAIMGDVNPLFSIFSLKHNFDWKDKREFEHSGNLSLTATLKDLEGDEF
jgi:hypothetical protein